jgi:hypothetical protein
MNEVAKCRRDHNRLGFAYQIGFARLFNRFPAQQPLEINDELLSFVAVQMNIDSERISDYALWQHTVSEHQARIQQYLGLRPFDLDESNALERFAFEESCRLEQTALGGRKTGPSEKLARSSYEHDASDGHADRGRQRYTVH